MSFLNDIIKILCKITKRGVYDSRELFEQSCLEGITVKLLLFWDKTYIKEHLKLMNRTLEYDIK